MLKERAVQVSSVEVDTLFVPVTRPYSAGGRQVTGNWHVLARITTSDGVQGHGYIVALRQGLVAAVVQATRELGSQLVGMHVLGGRGGVGAPGQCGRLGWPRGPVALCHRASRYCPVGCCRENAGTAVVSPAREIPRPLARDTPVMGCGIACHWTNWQNPLVAMWRMGIRP